MGQTALQAGGVGTCTGVPARRWLPAPPLAASYRCVSVLGHCDCRAVACSPQQLAAMDSPDSVLQCRP